MRAGTEFVLETYIFSADLHNAHETEKIYTTYWSSFPSDRIMRLWQMWDFLTLPAVTTGVAKTT